MIKRPKTRAGIISTRRKWRKANKSKPYPKYLHLTKRDNLSPRKKKRGNNPITQTQKINQAIQLFEDFRGHTPRNIDKIKMKMPDVALKIGQCDGILYTTTRNGKSEKFIHKFRKNSRPLLATSHDGSVLLLLGGAFAFTHRGIVDK